MTPDDRRGRHPHSSEDDLDDQDIGPLALHIKYLRRDVNNCVTREEFAPVKLLVYGVVAIFFTALLGGLISLWILTKHGAP